MQTMKIEYKVMISREMKWTRHVTNMEKIKNA